MINLIKQSFLRTILKLFRQVFIFLMALLFPLLAFSNTNKTKDYQPLSNLMSSTLSNYVWDMRTNLIENYLKESLVSQNLNAIKLIDEDTEITYFCWLENGKTYFEVEHTLLNQNPWKYKNKIKSILKYEEEIIGVLLIFPKNDTKTLVNLTKEEKSFIKSNPIIRVHNETNWPPYNYNKDGNPLGYSIDIMNLIAEKTGIKIEYVSGQTWNEYLDMMKNDSLDVMLNIVKTPERLKYLLYTSPYADTPNVILSKKGKDYKNIDSLIGKTVSIPKGFFTENFIKEKYPNINIHLVENTFESMKAVIFGNADAAFGELAVFNYLLNQHMMTNLYISGEVNIQNPDYSLLHLATRKNLPFLATILTKGLDSITIQEKNNLQRKWFIQSKSKGIGLTNEEQLYLNQKKSIKMCVDPDFLPFEKIDKDGKYRGIGADIINLVSKNIDKPLSLVHTKSWSESLNGIKDRKCDILPIATNTQSRLSYMNFTEPYIKESLVIATNTEHFFVKDSNDLINKRIGVVDGYSSMKQLKKRNPKIIIVIVKSAKEGLEKVENNELFGYVDALPTIAYNIQKYGLVDLKVAGSLEFDENFSLASRNDEPLLNTIMQKSLNLISEEQKRSIIGKWITIKIEQSFDYKKLLYISLFFLSILLVILYKNRSIKIINKELDEKNILLEKLSITDNLTKLYNRNKLDEELLNKANFANRDSSPFGVIIIDIDYFKSVNDTYGHQMGDIVLKEFADILKLNSRKTDTVGRWGGEEFLIICCNNNLQGMLTFANNLKEKISCYPFSLGEQKTASFGVSLYKKDESIDLMIKRADDALYNAKENGRNRVEYL